jgi:signal peptidase
VNLRREYPSDEFTIGHNRFVTDSSAMPPPGTPSEKVAPRERGLLHYIGVSLSGALLVLVFALALLVIVIPKVSGGIPLTVLTSSMIPHFPPGTLLVDVPVTASQLRIGDVATYQVQSGKPGVITHRIIAIQSDSNGKREFQFKGDNNTLPDPEPVVAAQIQGRVWYSLPLLGYVNSFVGGQNRSFIIPAIAALLFLYAGYTVVSAIIGMRRTRRAKTSELP